ncbi:MAG: hypothetical protein K6G49_02120 [Candidatus Saccharibacteria bacterium]|nr:hypothetical protein [Candidatus Saccharibacteria bacterium]
MKLRNKKTGEIGKILKQLSEDNQIDIITDDKLYVVNSLAELNEEWEDYEEPKPKKYWYIGDRGEIFLETAKEPGHIWHQARKEIGNYFETKEEAEKAVEKLKAWKRLKDKGFRFTGISRDLDTIYFDVDIENLADPVIKDLDICFRR